MTGGEKNLTVLVTVLWLPLPEVSISFLLVNCFFFDQAGTILGLQNCPILRSNSTEKAPVSVIIEMDTLLVRFSPGPVGPPKGHYKILKRRRRTILLIKCNYKTFDKKSIAKI